MIYNTAIKIFKKYDYTCLFVMICIIFGFTLVSFSWGIPQEVFATHSSALHKKIAVILYNFSNNTSQPFTPDQLRKTVFTSPQSVAAYYTEVSFGSWSLTGKNRIDGDIFGWVTIPNTDANCDIANLDWGKSAYSAITASGVDLSGYDSIIYWSPMPTGCSHGGSAILGGSASWVFSNNLNILFPSHELGHNFGLLHANYYSCVDTYTTPLPIGLCTSQEYGDEFDVMGSGFNTHFNTFHKGRLGWYGDINKKTVTGSGIYTIAALEKKSSGVQALRIPRQTREGTYYYLEYRRPYGFDNFSPADPVVNGVSIRIARDYSDTVTDRTHLIDMNPDRGSNGYDAALTVGKTFYDAPEGLSIKMVDFPTSNTARVEIILNPVCIRKQTSISISPIEKTQSLPPASYSITLTNNDTALCLSSTFSVTPGLPFGFSQSPSSITTTLDPGKSVTIPINLSWIPEVLSGTYYFWEDVRNTNTSVYVHLSTGSAKIDIITPTNYAPIITTVGSVHSLIVGSSHTHSGASATDSNGNLSSYSWSFISCPSTCPTLSGSSGNISGSSVSIPGPIYTPNVAGSYTIKLTVNDSGGLTVSSNLTESAVAALDTTLPTVSITSPLSGTTYTSAQTVTISASASDNVGVTKVDFYDNATLKVTDTTAPYSYGLSISNSLNGTHSWTAKAYDAAGNNQISSAVSLTVNIPSLLPPSTPTGLSGTCSGTNAAVTWNPSTNATQYGLAIDNTTANGWNASATCSGGANAGDIYNCNATSPYNFAGQAGANYTAQVWACNASGCSATAGPVSFSCPAATDTILPTVSISSPLSGTTYTSAQTVTISASASDNVGVTKVGFYLNNNLVLEDVSSPHQFAWDLKYVVNGTHSWTAKAYDAAGNSKISSAVSLTVNIPSTTSFSTTLSASPSSGTAPLNGVDLTATVSNTGGASLYYYFDCMNDGTFEKSYGANAVTSYTYIDACNYSSAGTYTAKVKVHNYTTLTDAFNTATISVSGLTSTTCPSGSTYYSGLYGTACTGSGTCWTTTCRSDFQNAAPYGYSTWWVQCLSGTSPQLSGSTCSATPPPPPPPPTTSCPSTYSATMTLSPSTVAKYGTGKALITLTGKSPGGFAISLSGAATGNSNTVTWNNYGGDACKSYHEVTYTAGTISGTVNALLNFWGQVGSAYLTITP